MQVIRYDDSDTGKTTLTATLIASNSLWRSRHGKVDIKSNSHSSNSLLWYWQGKYAINSNYFECKLFFVMILARDRRH